MKKKTYSEWNNVLASLPVTTRNVKEENIRTQRGTNLDTYKNSQSPDNRVIIIRTIVKYRLRFKANFYLVTISIVKPSAQYEIRYRQFSKTLYLWKSEFIVLNIEFIILKSIFNTGRTKQMHLYSVSASDGITGERCVVLENGNLLLSSYKYGL